MNRFFAANGEPTPEWWDVVGRFREKARAFWDWYERLQKVNIAQYPEWLKSEYSGLISRYQKLRKRVEEVTAAIDKVVNFFKNWDDPGMTDPDYPTKPDLGQMGAPVVIPIIGIAVIAGAITAMTYLITDTVTFFKKLEKFDQLRKEGVSAGKASQIVKETIGGNAWSTIAKSIPLALAGIFAVFVLPDLLGGKKNGR